jgi:acyl-CoA synthetase (AMP-forming)/AMP-acid ligase II
VRTTLEDPILEAWEATRAKNRDRAAILDAQGRALRTFSEIEESARHFASQLEAVSPAQVCAIQIGNHPDWPSLFLACLRNQLVVLPLEQTISDEQKQSAFQICNVAASVSGGRICTGDFAANDWGTDRPSLLKLTSGTTAVPRAVRFRSEQLLADCENICQTMGISECDLNFGVIPISHSYGFSNLLTPLIVHGVSLVLSNDRIPRAIIDGLAATRANVFPGMPVFYQSFCEMAEAPSLPDLGLCISAGAPLAPETAQAFCGKFRREIHSFYGASECGGICYVREAQPVPGFVGMAMSGVVIEQVDPDNPVSLIRVRSPAVGTGYFPDPDEGKLGGGIFVPDDLLEKTRGGYRIVGRSSDLINVAGKKVHPAEVEAEILRYEGVRAAIVFGRESERRNEEIAACVVAKGLSESELLAHCRARLSSWQVPRRIYFVETIPVNERGKTSRRELARRYPVVR